MKHLLLPFLVCIYFHAPLSAQEGGAVLTAKTKSEIIISVSKALERNYVYPDKAALMSAFLQQQQDKKVYDLLTNPNQFLRALSKDLQSVYHDNHLRFDYDPELEKRIIAFVTTSKKDDKDFSKEVKQNFFFKKLEILPSNIGYIEFTNFADTSAAARQTVRAAMQFVAHTDALIIDLRNNFGGSPAMCGEIASYFFTAKTYSGRSFNRIENKWTDSWIDNKKTITSGLVLNMPVYILTSHRSFSAAESLAYTLQQLKNAVVVGDSTRGGAHATRSFSVGNGFVAFIPFSRGENVKKKTDWEGTGVIPNIAVNESNSLAAAQKLILQHQLAIQTDENEKRKISWLIHFYQSKESTSSIPADVLAKYTGKFEEFVFYTQDGNLFCNTTTQKNKIDKLVPVFATLFQIDNESQVEFMLDEKGNCNSIKLYWRDGWVDTISKSGK